MPALDKAKSDNRHVNFNSPQATFRTAEESTKEPVQLPVIKLNFEEINLQRNMRTEHQPSRKNRIMTIKPQNIIKKAEPRPEVKFDLGSVLSEIAENFDEPV